MKRILEICCANPESVDAAISGGADRIELCSGLSVGGLTPSKGLIDYACHRMIPINVLIRPRSGDFVYTDSDFDVMLNDIAWSAQAGAKGVVIGALNPDGSIDYDRCKPLVDRARSLGLSITFHRAFDLCNSPAEGLEAIISLGCDRVLTSGQATDALSGAKVIADLVRQADGRIKIMAGAGINPSNVADIISRTGVTEVHASAKISSPSAMTFHPNEISQDLSDENECRPVTSAEIVANLYKIIRSLS